MKWTTYKKNKLEAMYDLGRTDIDMAAQLGTTELAVIRMRSTLGLVKFKQREGGHKAPKTIVAPQNINFLTLFYKDAAGQDHFSMITNGSRDSAKTVAQNLIQRQGIREVILLQPVSKMVFEGIKEVKLN